MKWTPSDRTGINALLAYDFLSAHYTEVAGAILLKMIFRVFSFLFNTSLDQKKAAKHVYANSRCDFDCKV